MKSLLIFTFILFTSNLFSQKSYNLLELDSLYKQASIPKEKLSWAFKMLEKAEQEFGANDTTYAKALNKIASAFIDINLDSSIIYFKKAIEIQRVKIPKHVDYASSLNNIGIAYYYQGNVIETEKYWAEAMLLNKEIFGEKHIFYLGSLVNLGNIDLELNKNAQAMELFLKAKKLFEEQNLTSHQFYPICLTNLGNIHEKHSDYEKAEAFYLSALKTQKATLGEDHPNYLVTLGNLAGLYKIMKDYEKAENFLLQVLKTIKSISGEGHYSYSKTLTSLANLYMDIKAYEKAEALNIQNLEFLKATKGVNSQDYIIIVGNMGELYRNKKDYTRAEAFLVQAIELSKKKYGASSLDNAVHLDNLGAFYIDIGQYEKAKDLYLKTYNIYKTLLNPKNKHIINVNNNLAAVCNNLNEFDQAWNYVLQAIQANTDFSLSSTISPSWADSLEKANYVSYDEINTSLNTIYNIFGKQNNKDVAKQQVLLGDLALKLLQKKKNKISAESDQLRVLNESSNWVLRSMEVLDKEKDAAKAFELSEQNKSVLVLDAISTKRAYKVGLLPDSLVQLEKELEKQYSNTQAALIEKRSEKEQDSIRAAFVSLNFKMDQLQTKIQKDYPEYASTKYQSGSIQASEIQKLLDEKSALLEYLIGDSVIYIFYVDQSQVKVHEFWVSNYQLKQKIRALHDALSNYKQLKDNKTAYHRYIESAYWFYENLVAPALKNDNQKIQNLIIVTDGELGHLPFEAFLTKPAPQEVSNYNQLHYLMKDYKISYNYSASLWKENKNNVHHKKTINNQGQLLAVAPNYEYSLDSIKIELRLPADMRNRAGLESLSAARREVETLAQNFKGFFAFDTLASEKLFKEKASDYSIIHLAMHGLLNQKDQVLSALAFTEDGDNFENNFLQAYEIAKMELNADLVVLSACETGYGKFEHGNGIASLARSFMYAGVPSMIVSLWQVNDFATAEIMKNLYDNLYNNMPKDEALQQAKISYLNTAVGISAHPAFWSSFILIGNNNPVFIAPNNEFSIWFVIVGIVSLFLGSVFLYKRLKS